MALETFSMPLPCVTWKTALPQPFNSVVSPSFRLKECEAKFSISKNHDNVGDFGVYIKTTNILGTAYIGVSTVRENGQYCKLFWGEVCFSNKCLPFKTSFVSGDHTFYDTKIFDLKKNEIGILVDKITLAFVFHLKDSFYVKEGDETASSSSKEINPEELSNHLCLLSLSEDIGKLFDNEEHSDAVLKCGDRSFFVNKRILSARSEVFAAMFRNKMSENETGVVDVTDFKPDILEHFLRYIYSGVLDTLNMDSVYEFYRAADKYAISSLKRKCALFMVDNLSEENVCEVLLLADTFSDDELLEKAKSFAVDRPEFLGCDKWISFSELHPAIAVKVFVKFHAKRPNMK